MEFLPAHFFIKSRSKLKELLLPSSLVIVSSNRTMPRNGDQNYPFRQSSDLYYLTGIKEANCTLVIVPATSPNTYTEVLFIPENDSKQSRWDGPGISIETARKISGIQDIRLLNTMHRDMLEFILCSRVVYFGTPLYLNGSAIPGNEKEIRRETAGPLATLEEHLIAPLMMRIRMFKELEEISMLKKAIDITNYAFLRVLEELKPGMKEHEVAAILSYEFQCRGAKEHAFDPIIASGVNALILHYIENRSECKDGDLLLMDFGADWEYFAADISRTIPINGRYNGRQRELYDANLRVINKAMELLKPGKLLKEYHQEVGLVWEEEHVNLGLYNLNDIKTQSAGKEMWKSYYWHGTSHSIGIDVHDPFDQTIVLQEGMVLSCEPGIYIPEEGIGIRLENDMYIGNDELVNLSKEIPIDPELIEARMNKS